MTTQRPLMTTLETRRLGALLATLLAGAALAGPAQAIDFVVTNLADSGEGSLRQAILDANENEEADTITFDETLAGETILLSSGELTIADDTADPDLTINGDVDGDGTPDITVDAQGGSRVFLIASGADATLQGLVITGGNAFSSDGFNGGGILNDGGMLTVTSSAIDGNSAQFGGGILNDGLLAVTSSTISGNSASFDGGGIHHDDGTLTVTRSTISGNSANQGGGAIENNDGGTLTLVNSTISGNVAGAGSGIANFGALIVEASTISGNNNSSSLFGAGIRQEPGGTLVSNGAIITGNSPGDCSAAPSPRWGSISRAARRAASRRPAINRTSRSRPCW